MNLFQKYQSRALQFSIDVLSALIKKQELSDSQFERHTAKQSDQNKTSKSTDCPKQRT